MESIIDSSAMFTLSYGLFVLSCRDGNKDNACIINTASQITDNPKMITVAVNNANLSCDIIKKTGVFNVTVLSTAAKFSLFERFGFKSGKDTDKFAGFNGTKRSENGVFYITENSNAYISARVVSSASYGSHTLFVAVVTAASKLSELPSATYQYYFDNIKPKMKKPDKKIAGYVCKICGYIYEGEDLPPDFVCPICKHPAADFEAIM